MFATASIRTRCFALLSSLIFSSAGLRAAAEDPLAHLRPGHPRLLLTNEGFTAAVAAAKSDPLRAALHERIIATAEQVLSAPPVRHIAAGNLSLDQARYAVHYILTCALAYRLTADARFEARAKSDLLTVAAFPDWNPAHFLDVGEMSFAVAIGYDWLYPQLQPEERAVLKRALLEKSLSFADAAYQPGGPTGRYVSWAKEMSNWSLGSTRPPTVAENQNEGTALLAIDLTPEAEGRITRVVVLLTPVGDKWPRLSPPVLGPLADWR